MKTLTERLKSRKEAAKILRQESDSRLSGLIKPIKDVLGHNATVAFHHTGKPYLQVSHTNCEMFLTIHWLESGYIVFKYNMGELKKPIIRDMKLNNRSMVNVVVETFADEISKKF